MADELNNGQQVQSTEGHESEAINVAGLKAALQKFKTDKVDPLQWPMVAVAELPTATASTMHKIYLVPSTNPKQKNAKDEFITIDNGSEAQTRYTWEQIGSTTVDLSNYATLQALADAIASVRAEDVAVTTLNTAPTSSTTSYTKGGQSVDFKIGDEVRVADAEQATEGANGYVYYKLYDLVDNQGTKTAYWDLIGSGSVVAATGSINVSIAAYVNDVVTSSSLLGDITVTLTNITDGGAALQMTWSGTDVVFGSLITGKDYRIAIEDKSGWLRNKSYDDVISLGTTEETVSFTYSADEYTCVVSGASAGRIIINSTEYANGATFRVAKNTSITATAKQVDLYATSTPNISGKTITAAYVAMTTGYIILDQTSSDPTTKVLDESNHTYSSFQRPAVITAIRNASHCYVGTFANNKMTLKQLSDSDGTMYADGTSAATDIASTSKDVFMRLPYFYTRVSEVTTDKIKIEFAYDSTQTATSTASAGSGWKLWGGNDLIGKYEAYHTSNKTYSISGQTPTVSVSYANFKAHARARGTGYTLVKWRHHCIMAILFYAYYGHTNCQTICGSGASSHDKQTGLKNTLGMTDTDSSTGNTNNIVFWGLENWWGNTYEFVDNVSATNPTWTITEDDGTERTITYQPSATGTDIYPSKFQLGENLDVIPVSGEPVGSDSTGYCDPFFVRSGGPYITFRSGFNANTKGGMIFMRASDGTTSSSDSFCSRLAFTGTIEIS